MGISLAASYWQIFWVTVLRTTLAVPRLDALAGLLGSVIDFADYRALRVSPLLAVMALLSWLVPLASLLPPATLSVISTETTQRIPSHIPVPAFNFSQMAFTFKAVNYSLIEPLNDDNQFFFEVYDSLSTRVSRLAAQVALQGYVPDFEANRPNSSATVNFAGPAVQCLPIAPEILRPFNEIMDCSFISANRSIPEQDICNVAFVAWVPDRDSRVPFEDHSAKRGFLPLKSESSALDPDAGYSGGFLGRTEFGGPATLFVAKKENTELLVPDAWTVLNCSLYNASYAVRLTSNANKRGTVSLLDTHPLGSVIYQNSTSQSRFGTSVSDFDSFSLSYMAMMEALGMLMVGAVTFGQLGDSIVLHNVSSHNERGVHSQNPELMRTLLRFTTELLPFLGQFDLLPGAEISLTLPTRPDETMWKTIATIDNNRTYSLPREAFSSTTFNQSLGSAIEELFRNMTLSLFSDGAFLKQSELEVQMLLSHTQNTYAYSRNNLLLSYGIAAGLVLVACLVGCTYIWLSGESYSNRLSTMYRTAGGLGGDTIVAIEDRSGADPLPKYLAKTRLALGNRDGTGQAPMQIQDDSVEMDHQYVGIDQRYTAN
ncbi:hypothetical protein Q7P37_004579 [Cladosporium fusiforme]